MNPITQKIKEAYNTIALDWDKEYVDTTWWLDGKNKFVSLLPPGASVLDVGCGNGAQSVEFAQAGLDVTGFDVAEKMIGLAKKKVPSGKFFVRDVYDIATVSGFFDAIYAQAVLLHLPRKDVPEILAELMKKLKPSGILYVAVKEKRANGPDEDIKHEDNYGYVYERFFSYFTLSELRAWFREIGLEIVWELQTTSGRSNWLQLIGKKNK
jgi:2-polyprenyl-3-methyl-5-hydroxy-6-metoxy-1,4-benzoquinol methylase